MRPAWKPFEAAILEAFDLMLSDGLEHAPVPDAGDAEGKFWYDAADVETTIWLAYRQSFVTGRPAPCDADGDQRETEDSTVAFVLTFAMDHYVENHGTWHEKAVLFRETLESLGLEENRADG